LAAAPSARRFSIHGSRMAITFSLLDFTLAESWRIDFVLLRSFHKPQIRRARTLFSAAKLRFLTAGHITTS
jgi:hypothetical protein